MNIEDCEGCGASIIGDRCSCFDKRITCPCSTCLIKVMCKVGCNLLWDHLAKIRRLRDN